MCAYIKTMWYSFLNPTLHCKIHSFINELMVCCMYSVIFNKRTLWVKGKFVKLNRTRNLLGFSLASFRLKFANWRVTVLNDRTIFHVYFGHVLLLYHVMHKEYCQDFSLIMKFSLRLVAEIFIPMSWEGKWSLIVHD